DPVVGRETVRRVAGDRVPVPDIVRRQRGRGDRLRERGQAARVDHGTDGARVRVEVVVVVAASAARGDVRVEAVRARVRAGVRRIRAQGQLRIGVDVVLGAARAGGAVVRAKAEGVDRVAGRDGGR